MSVPLVSVICLCYNQEQFVEESINSVLLQTYPNIQLIIVDDASQDNGVAVIKKIAEQNSLAEIVLIKQNLGNCKAFNRGLALAKGEYIIDLAADDVLMPDRIEKQVNLFNTLSSDYGVVFTDAEYIDEDGKFIRNHYEYLFQKGLLHEMPQGDVYRNVVSQYFISSPTMLIKRKVMDVLHGYDEQLAYEDFDFWVRSARTFKYAFLNEKLTRVRKIQKSMSKGWYVPGDKQLHSTYLVCKKAQALSLSVQDNEALIKRVRYELRQSFFSENFDEAILFYDLLKELTQPSNSDQLIFFAIKRKLRFSFLRALYHKIRFSQL